MSDNPKLKLNLGCGNQRYRGYIGIDFAGSGADVLHNLTEPLPYGEGEIDEIHCSHVIEHFPIWQIKDILRNWHNVMADGGLFWGFVPDAVKYAENYLVAIAGKNKELRDRCVRAVYGDFTEDRHHGPGQIHYAMYDKDALLDLISSAGFSPVQVTPIQMGLWDWRLMFMAGKGVYEDQDIQAIGVYPDVWWRKGQNTDPFGDAKYE